MIAENKEKLRRRLIDKRALLDEQVVRQGSQGAMELLRAMAEWKNAGEVLIYWPIKQELDVRPLVAELWQRGSRVLMPRCRPDVLGEMDIACATCEDDLRPGPFSIMQPDAESCPPVGSCRPDIAIIPAVCFDRQGYRLGFGGGYYDRLLAEESMKETLKVGMAYTFQLVETLPTEPWDMPVDIICTEEELWRP